MVYDCIVLGVGGVGSFAFLSAVEKGWKTLGIDRFGCAHDKGSSHGRTRFIRTAYFEHPNYVPMARQAWDQWQQIQQRCNVKLIQPTGLLQVGNPDGEVIRGVLEIAQKHDIDIQRWTSREAMQRFPAFQLNDHQTCIYEDQAGYLLIENCVTSAIKMAIEAGGQFKSDTLVDGIAVEPSGVVVLHSAGQEFRCERLIICAGPWSRDFIQDFDIDLEIVRKQQHWFQLDRVDIKYENKFPGFLIEDETGCFYGFPEIDYLGMKIAEHSGGMAVETADDVDRSCDSAELSRVEQFMDRTLQFTRRRLVHHSVCMYSMSSDGHFILDHHPKSHQIVFAAGLSGHGYKFAPVLGKRLVAMLEGQLDSAYDFLKMANRNLF